MAKAAGISKEYVTPFNLDEQKLSKLVEVIKEHAKKLPFETYIELLVGREDNSYYITNELQEVLTDENTQSKSINNLIIELHKTVPDPSQASVPPSKRTPLASILFSITKKKVVWNVEGPDRGWAFLVADDLGTQSQRVLTKTVPLFFLSRAFDSIVFISLGTIAIALILWFAWPFPSRFSNDQIVNMTTEQRTIELLKISSSRVRIADLAILGPPFIYPIIILLIYLRPLSRALAKTYTSVFYWGDMVPVYDGNAKKLSQIKWGVIIAFIVSLLGSILAGALIAR